jgi:hypothetical protein
MMRATFFAAALVAAACHSTPPARTPATASGTLSNHTAAAPRHATSDLALLPVDSDMVVGVNFAQLQHSQLWQQFVAPKLAAIPGLDKFRDLCGFDPLQSLQTLAVGMRMGADGDDPTGTVVVHGYSRKQALGCFDKNGISEAEKDGSKVAIDGDVVMITDKSGKQLGFTFVDDTTAIAVIGPDAATKASIERVASGEGQGLDTSPSFQDLYGKVNTHDSIWMLINAQTPAFQKASAMGVHMKAVFGSINVTDGLTVDLHMRVGSPDEATSFVSMAKGQLASSPQIQQFVDKLDITSTAADVNVAVAMGEQKLMTIAGLLGGMFGGGASMAAPTGP